MTKKAKLKKEIEERQKELKELEELQEKERLETVEKINALIGDKYMCGVVITENDLVAIVQLMLKSKETVSIPFNLYIKDEKEKENGTV